MLNPLTLESFMGFQPLDYQSNFRAPKKRQKILSNLTLVDNLTDGDGNPLALSAGPVFTSSDASSAQGNLAVGEVATYTATYTISQLSLIHI